MRRPKQSVRVNFGAAISDIVAKYGSLEKAACKMGRKPSYLDEAKTAYYHMAPLKILEEIKVLLGVDYRKHMIKNKKKETLQAPAKQMDLRDFAVMEDIEPMTESEQMICALNRVADAVMECTNIIAILVKELQYEKI